MQKWKKLLVTSYLSVLWNKSHCSYVKHLPDLQQEAVKALMACNIKLTAWSNVLLEKLTGPQLVKKFPAFHGNGKFITMFTRACLYPEPDESSDCLPVLFLYVPFLYYSHIYVCAFQVTSSLQDALPKRFRIFLLSHTCHMPRPSHHPSFDHPNEAHHCSFLQSPFSLLSKFQIFPQYPIFEKPQPLLFLSDQVLHPYKHYRKSKGELYGQCFYVPVLMFVPGTAEANQWDLRSSGILRSVGW